MRYRRPDSGGPGVETMTFEQLRVMNQGGTQRAEFSVVARVSDGGGFVTVDFETHALRKGSAVWIPPGVVHRWDDIRGVSGDLVLFVPTAPLTDTLRAVGEAADGGAVWDVPEVARPYVDAGWEHLVMETDERAPASTSDLRRLLLSALLSRLDRPPGRDGERDPIFRAFQRRVELHFRERHDAEYYASALGYSPRTVLRAVQDATGRSSKRYILDRIVLEAKRLLVHEGLSASACATVLGFTDPSNFSAVFRQAEGLSPGRWLRSTTSPQDPHRQPTTPPTPSAG